MRRRRVAPDVALPRRSRCRARRLLLAARPAKSAAAIADRAAKVDRLQHFGASQLLARPVGKLDSRGANERRSDRRNRYSSSGGRARTALDYPLITGKVCRSARKPTVSIERRGIGPVPSGASWVAGRHAPIVHGAPRARSGSCPNGADRGPRRSSPNESWNAPPTASDP
jgi:hypothetical protein